MVVLTRLVHLRVAGSVLWEAGGRADQEDATCAE